MPSLLNPVIGLLMLRGVITEPQQPTPRTRTKDDTLPDLATGPGQRARVLVGPGRGVPVGERVRLGRPEGSFTLRPDVGHPVFVGEESASVALGAMAAVLPEHGFTAVGRGPEAGPRAGRGGLCRRKGQDRSDRTATAGARVGLDGDCAERLSRTPCPTGRRRPAPW